VVPVRTDLLKTIYEPLSPANAILARALVKGKAPYSRTYDALFNDMNGPWYGMLNQAIFGAGKSIEDIQADAQAKAEAIADEAEQ